MKKTGKEHKFTVQRKEIKIDNIHMKRCSTFLVIREYKFKPAIGYHFSPVRSAEI